MGRSGSRFLRDDPPAITALQQVHVGMSQGNVDEGKVGGRAAATTYVPDLTGVEPEFRRRSPGRRGAASAELIPIPASAESAACRRQTAADDGVPTIVIRRSAQADDDRMRRPTSTPRRRVTASAPDASWRRPRCRPRPRCSARSRRCGRSSTSASCARARPRSWNRCWRAATRWRSCRPAAASR